MFRVLNIIKPCMRNLPEANSLARIIAGDVVEYSRTERKFVWGIKNSSALQSMLVFIAPNVFVEPPADASQM